MKLLNLAGSLPDEHCSGCVEGKSRMMPRPKGHTERPIPRARPQKLYVDLSGRIEEGSVFHSYHYYLAGLDGEGNLNTPIAMNYLEGVRECEVITTSAGAYFRRGKVELFHTTIKGTGRTLMFDSGVSAQFGCYAVVHAVLIYNMLTMTT